MPAEWPLDEDQRRLVGRLIVEAIENGEEFPSTPEAGMEWLKIRGFKFNLDSKVTGVKFNQSERGGVMHLTIPPRESVLERLAQIDEGEAYALPDSYQNILEGISNLTDREQFEFRVGDYSISHCD